MLKKHKLQLIKAISAKQRYLAFKPGCPESSWWTIKKDHSSVMAESIFLTKQNRKATGICLKNHVSQLLSHFTTIYHFELKGGRSRLIRSLVKYAQFFLFPLSHRYINFKFTERGGGKNWYSTYSRITQVVPN